MVLGGIGGGERGAGLVLDDRGGLWGWGMGRATKFGESGAEGGRTEMFRLRKGGKDRLEMGRITYGGVRGDDAVVASETEVLLYDLRVLAISSLLFNPCR